MAIKSKHVLKQLFDNTSKLPPSKFYELIDALWNRHKVAESKVKSGKVIIPDAGTYTITFNEAFTIPYTVMVEGRRTKELSIVRVIDDSDLAFFTIKTISA